jgi:hypothetical protein
VISYSFEKELGVNMFSNYKIHCQTTQKIAIVEITYFETGGLGSSEASGSVISKRRCLSEKECFLNGIYDQCLLRAAHPAIN